MADLARQEADRQLDQRLRLERERRQIERIGSTLDVARWASVEPYQAADFHVELAGHCDMLARAAVSREHVQAAFSAPPRHGKTMLLGECGPVYAAIEARRKGVPLRMLYVTAGGQRAQRVSQTVQRHVARIYEVTRDEWWAPSSLWQRSEWATRGGLEWIAVGALSATGGIGAHWLMMDDLIGHGEVYRSAAKRDRIWRAVEEDILSRRMGGAAGHMETRRGVDDTTGRLTERYPEQWPLHAWRCYDPGRGYLWPEQYGEAWRASMPHLTDESPLWRSLYQQEPVPDGDYLIPWTWLEATHDMPPSPEAAVAYDRIVVGVDLAATGRTTSDECAYVVIGCRGAYRDLLHVHAAQMDYPSQRAYLRELARTWQASTVVVERAAGGDALVADLQAVVRGIRGERAAADKVTRLMPHLPMMQAGQLRFPRHGAPWLLRVQEQMAGFTGVDGERDDIVDALVWALVAGQGRQAPSILQRAQLLDGMIA